MCKKLKRHFRFLLAMANKKVNGGNKLPKNQGNYRENVVDPKFQSFSNSGKLKSKPNKF